MSCFYSSFRASDIGSSCVKKRRILSIFPLCGHFLALGTLAVALSWGQAHAASASHYTLLNADDLDLSAPCAQVHLKVDPSLKTGLALEESTAKATAIHTTRDGAEQSVHVALPSCKRHFPLFFRLAPGTTLTLHDSPLANITILGTLSTLESSLTDATVHIDHVQSLDLSIRGTSSVYIHQLDRAAEILTAEQAHLSVDQAFLSALSAQMSGSSQLSIATGQIDTLSLIMTEHSNASVMAQLGTANTSTQDDASLTLGHVTNALNQSGNGHVQQIAPPEQPTTAPAPTPAPSAPTPSIPDGSAQGLGTPQMLPTQRRASQPSVTPPEKHTMPAPYHTQSTP